MRNICVLAITTILAACASEPIGRDNPRSVQVVSSDTINVRRVVELVACITEGFKKSPQTIWHNHQTSQEIIVNGYRIEMRGTEGGTLMLSADIFNDGNVKLYTSIYGPGSLLGIEDQKKSAIFEYKKCVKDALS